MISGYASTHRRKKGLGVRGLENEAYGMEGAVQFLVQATIGAQNVGLSSLDCVGGPLSCFVSFLLFSPVVAVVVGDGPAAGSVLRGADHFADKVSQTCTRTHGPDVWPRGRRQGH